MSFVLIKQLMMGTNSSPSRRRSSVLYDYDDLESTAASRSSAHLLPKGEGDNLSSWPHGRFISPRLLSDATVGLADGLTVPFALTAGLATLQSARLVVYAGLAELVAGAISMALGGYLGALSEERARSSLRRDVRERVRAAPVVALAEAADVLARYFPSELVGSLVGHLANEVSQSGQSDDGEEKLARLLLEVGHGEQAEEAAGASRPWASAGTIGASYFLGGLVPLVPYMLARSDGAEDGVRTAFAWSVGVMALALAAFGWTKSAVVGGWRGREAVVQNAWEAVVMVFVGGVAAAVAMGCVAFVAGGERAGR